MSQKVALVTGASSGIGAAIVVSLAKAGYLIMAAGRDVTRTQEIGKQVASARTWTGDITSQNSCVELVSACIDEFGRLDLLVNNAGIYRTANAEATTDEIWSTTMAARLPGQIARATYVLSSLRDLE